MPNPLVLPTARRASARHHRGERGRRVPADALLLAIVCGGPLAAQSERKESAELDAARLVERLGSASFAVREEATRALIALGVPAIGALERGTRSPDREVRFRSRLVLDLIRELDFRRRVNAFAADREGRLKHDLPGWDRYREHVGDDQHARSLFADMQRTEPRLMRAVGAPSMPKAFARRCFELRQNMQFEGVEPDAASIAAVLFVSGHPQVRLAESTNSTVMLVCANNEFYTAMTRGAARRPLRRLLVGWLIRDDNHPVRDALALAMQYDIPELLHRAERTAAKADENIDNRLEAVRYLAKFGDDNQLPLLEQLLEDDAVCAVYERVVEAPPAGTQRERVTIQVRDVALAALLHLGKRDFAEFGYDRLHVREPFVFPLNTLGFPQDAQRRAAIDKWRRWRQRKST